MNGYAGKTYCPTCGGLHLMRIVSRDANGYPKTVCCCGCNKDWGPWLSQAELAERKRQRQREKNRRWREAHPDEHRRRVRDYCRKKRAEERAKHEYEYDWATCPTCGTEFIKNVHNQVFCSTHCRNMQPDRRLYMKHYAHERNEAIKAGTWKVDE